MSELRSQKMAKLVERLRKQRAITSSDEELLRDTIRTLETDVSLQKRRVHSRIAAAGQWHSEQQSLHQEIARLQDEVADLQQQVEKRSLQVRQMAAELKHKDAAVQDLEHGLEEAEVVARETTSQYVTFAKADFFPVSAASPDPVHQDPFAFLAAVIEAAHDSIVVMTHSFTNVLLAEALAAAAKRGVQVRVLYDSAWLHGVLQTASDSVARSEWQRVYRRWKNNPVQHFGQRGRRTTSHITARHMPFHHNVVVVDEMVMLTGTWPFAVEQNLELDSSFVVLTGTDRLQNPCIASTLALFERFWETKIPSSQPLEMTTVRLPRLSRSTTRMTA
ncbi:uncharacterized protein MONBRDRAFT_11237 [Monosiga brevicollis MX1]|uniref:Mitochondrial cardiolipin hydrolase n=1 Tax=Monosiga brevicollis TaxID=81824 RepID=A9V8L9_MONBE|nr:uncharacterized protein MONBRDRAFT_11237 [Monosiga brevicollis MX1]EDQ86107.1 predicted protein [Monosiga brevicollis MX1]|eukprot:XP_001749032.1 hypothetical protein [Monosiga brevicollis MX1]